jgi:hypothetical protein
VTKAPRAAFCENSTNSFGIVTVKDFGSILSVHAETRAELLAALREIGDGEWTRRVGVDGGKALHWTGLLFGVTGVIDNYHGVISSLGDRWLLTPMAPVKDKLAKALKQCATNWPKRSNGCSPAVAKTRAKSARTKSTKSARPSPSWSGCAAQSNATGAPANLRLSTALRAADASASPLNASSPGSTPSALNATWPSAWSKASLWTAFRRSAVGLTSLLWRTAESTPPPRVATALGLPTITVRRVLEDLAAYGLINRESGGSGNADKWTKGNWENEE